MLPGQQFYFPLGILALFYGTLMAAFQAMPQLKTVRVAELEMHAVRCNVAALACHR